MVNAIGFSVSQLGGLPAGLNELSNVGVFLLAFAWAVRTWPYWKSKINEARKIQLDADGERLAQAFARIHELEETQSADRRQHHNDMLEERRRCEAELDVIRNRLATLEDENRGLMAVVRQNSSSTAHMIGRPGAVAVSKAARRARGEDAGGD